MHQQLEMQIFMLGNLDSNDSELLIEAIVNGVQIF